MTVHVVFEPDPAYKPRQEGVHLLYDQPETPDDNENIQVMVKPPHGNEAKEARSRLAQAKPENRTLAGQPAQTYVKFIGQAVDRYEIFLPDAYIVMVVWGCLPTGWRRCWAL